MALTITQTSNINASGQLLQIWLDRTVLENFEPNLRFYDMWEKPARPAGYNTLAWTRCNKLTVTPAQASLTEGVTPDDVAINFTTISLTANQYGMYAIITDILDDVSPVPMIENAAKVIWANMARIIDQVIQWVLAVGTNVIYAGTAANRAALAATDVMTPTLLAKANAFLSTKAAPVYGDGYIAVMHPNVLFDLLVHYFLLLLFFYSYFRHGKSRLNTTIFLFRYISFFFQLPYYLFQFPCY